MASDQKSRVLWQCRAVHLNLVAHDEPLEEHKQGQMAKTFYTERVCKPAKSRSGAVPENLVFCSNHPSNRANLFESAAVGAWTEQDA
jgi:hypothetical protein